MFSTSLLKLVDANVYHWFTIYVRVLTQLK